MSAERTPSPLRCLTIAGSDSGGGAGIQADLMTFAALGVYGTSAITAVTAQNTRAILAIEALSPKTVRLQIEAVLEDIGTCAVKTGMLYSPEIVRAVAETLRIYRVPALIVDPVLTAKTSDRLLKQEALEALKTELFPLAWLITPNLPEAAALLDQDESSLEPCRHAAQLLQWGSHAALLKGGHSPDKSGLCRDYLVLKTGESHQFETERIQTSNTHGTGCTLSAAITAYIARGLALPDAVRLAQRFTASSLKAAIHRRIGSGHGPLAWFAPHSQNSPFSGGN